MDREVQQMTTIMVSCAAASTQYTKLLPTGVKTLRMQARDKADEIWFGFSSTPVTGNVRHTLRASEVIELDNLYFDKATLFYASPATHAILEILAGR